jgi:hypothetical protein
VPHPKPELAGARVSNFPPNGIAERSVPVIMRLFIAALVIEFGVIAFALYRLVAATVDLRLAVDDVLGKLSETEAEMRQLREDVFEPKNGKSALRRERQTIEL